MQLQFIGNKSSNPFMFFFFSFCRLVGLSDSNLVNKLSSSNLQKSSNKSMVDKIVNDSKHQAMVRKLKISIQKKNMEIKRLRSIVYRRDNKILSMHNIVDELKEKNLISDTAHDFLKVSVFKTYILYIIYTYNLNINNDLFHVLSFELRRNFFFF